MVKFMAPVTLLHCPFREIFTYNLDDLFTLYLVWSIKNDKKVWDNKHTRVKLKKLLLVIGKILDISQGKVKVKVNPK